MFVRMWRNQTWYKLTDKWVLTKDHGVSTIKLRDHMKFKRKEDQRVDDSVLLRRGNKIIKGSRGWEVLVRKKREKLKRGEESGMGRDRDVQRVRKLNRGV